MARIQWMVMLGAAVVLVLIWAVASNVGPRDASVSSPPIVPPAGRAQK